MIAFENALIMAKNLVESDGGDQRLVDIFANLNCRATTSGFIQNNFNRINLEITGYKITISRYLYFPEPVFNPNNWVKLYICKFSSINQLEKFYHHFSLALEAEGYKKSEDNYYVLA